VPRTPSKREVVRKAAEQGLRRPVQPGRLLRQGHRGAQGPRRGVKWFARPLNRIPQAQYSLASATTRHRRAQGLRRAAKWLRKAAEQSDAEAQNNLALCYAMANGVPKDHVEAVKWFRKAAEQDHTDAQVNLAVATLKATA